MRHRDGRALTDESRGCRESRSVPSASETASKTRLPFRTALPESLRGPACANAQTGAARLRYPRLTRRSRLRVRAAHVLRVRTAGFRCDKPRFGRVDT